MRWPTGRRARSPGHNARHALPPSRPGTRSVRRAPARGWPEPAVSITAQRFSAPLSRSTNRAVCRRIVASSCIAISTRSSALRSSSQGCTELSHWHRSPSAARRGRWQRLFDGRPRRPCTTLSSPSASYRRRRRRKWRGVTPSRAAPAVADSTPSLTCLSTEMRSLSLSFSSICSSPEPCSVTEHRTWSERGHF